MKFTKLNAPSAISAAPIPPSGVNHPSNDAIERVKLILTNPSERADQLRLMFLKTRHGFQQRIGTPITGLNAILRDANGHPSGIPVQLSKNWHVHPEGGHHSGQWFHGITQLTLPPKAALELELTMIYGHWGGLPAASHAQLSLIGWGANQQWDQSALGSWGESICYEPEQLQGKATVTDVRPLMVRSIGDKGKWNWTNNVGGADFFRFFDSEGNRHYHAAMRTDYHKPGPCLTDTTYRGQIGRQTGIFHHINTTLARRDDLVSATYRIRMHASKAVDFSRLSIFQTGADTYSTTQEKKVAVGNAAGLVSEWPANWGGNTYHGQPIECVAPMPWASLHETLGNPHQPEEKGAWANRGFIIREWNAKLGGQPANPWIAEYGVERGSKKSSLMEIVPPPGVTRLEPGDFVDAVIEFIIIPEEAGDYYGPNETFRQALQKQSNTWNMVQRQATEGTLEATTEVGTLEKLYPGVQIRANQNQARLTLKGGLSYVPITVTGLTQHSGFQLLIDGQPLDQSVHGDDFWQTDYHTKSGTWSVTYNVP
ncbi:MAG: hypothetical protein AAF226_15170, partial [Verrucomicrobiota bacterium]